MWLQKKYYIDRRKILTDFGDEKSAIIEYFSAINLNFFFLQMFYLAILELL